MCSCRWWLLPLTVLLVTAWALADNKVVASQDGEGEDCTDAHPCDLETAAQQVDAGDTLLIQGHVVTESTLVVDKDNVRLVGAYEKDSMCGIECAVADDVCIRVQGANFTMSLLEVNGTCYGTCLSLEANTTAGTTVNTELVAWQSVVVSAVNGSASLVRLRATEGLSSLGMVVQKASLPGEHSAVVVKEASAAEAPVSAERTFVYGRLDSMHDGAFLCGLDSVTCNGTVTLVNFSFHGLDIGDRAFLGGAGDMANCHISLSNGTVDQVHGHAFVSMQLTSTSRFIAHTLSVSHSTFDAALLLEGVGDRVADVYIDEAVFTANEGRMIEAAFANSIVSSLTATENTDFSLFLSGSVSLTNSAISFNSNSEQAIVQITGVDSLEYRLPTPTSMVYISSCDFSSNTNTPLLLSTVDGDDPRDAGVLLTTATFLNNQGSTAGAVSLDLQSTGAHAQLMYCGFSENSAADETATVTCSGKDSGASVTLQMDAFLDNTPEGILGTCIWQCVDETSEAVECPKVESVSETSDLLFNLVLIAVLILIPVSIGACITHRCIVSRRNKALEDNLAANDMLFELEEYHKD